MSIIHNTIENGEQFIGFDGSRVIVSGSDEEGYTAAYYISYKRSIVVEADTLDAALEGLVDQMNPAFTLTAYVTNWLLERGEALLNEMMQTLSETRAANEALLSETRNTYETIVAHTVMVLRRNGREGRELIPSGHLPQDKPFRPQGFEESKTYARRDMYNARKAIARAVHGMKQGYRNRTAEALLIARQDLFIAQYRLALLNKYYWDVNQIKTGKTAFEAYMRKSYNVATFTRKAGSRKLESPRRSATANTPRRQMKANR